MEAQSLGQTPLHWSATFVGDPAPAIRTFFEPGALPRPIPFYLQDAGTSPRRENMTDAAVDCFRAHYRNPVLSKWSIYDYLYAMLHHPAYRQKLAGWLHGELPPIPFAADFRAFQRAGQELLHVHTNGQKLGLNISAETARIIATLPSDLESA